MPKERREDAADSIPPSVDAMEVRASDNVRLLRRWDEASDADDTLPAPFFVVRSDPMALRIFDVLPLKDRANSSDCAARCATQWREPNKDR